eukprot:15530533-Heterocapsa_arctica.AAC.1
MEKIEIQLNYFIKIIPDKTHSTITICKMEKIETQPNHLINIILNKMNSTITIEDMDIGMTKNKMIKNMGTIAKSDIKSFTEVMAAGNNISMIDQFDVELCPAHLDSNKLHMVNMHNDDE